MKKVVRTLGLAVALVAAVIGGQYIERCSYRQERKLHQSYRSYVVSTEHLLDLINAKWSWVDAFDHDGYYESREEVFYLDSIGLKREKDRQEKCFQMNAQMFNN